MSLARLRNAAPQWTSIHAFAHHPALKLSPLWLLMVPLLVKALKYLHARGMVPADFFGLPFAFEWLYLSALLAFVANVVVAVRGPRFISAYPTYDAFERTKKTSKQLLEEFAEQAVACHAPVRSFALNAIQIAQDFAGQTVTEESRAAIRENRITTAAFARTLVIPPAALSDTFWHIRGFMDDLRPASRLIAITLYVTAVACVAVVVIRNAMIVGEYIMS